MHIRVCLVDDTAREMIMSNQDIASSNSLHGNYAAALCQTSMVVAHGLQFTKSPLTTDKSLLFSAEKHFRSGLALFAANARLLYHSAHPRDFGFHRGGKLLRRAAHRLHAGVEKFFLDIGAIKQAYDFPV